jgi:hypothetical protein
VIPGKAESLDASRAGNDVCPSSFHGTTLGVLLVSWRKIAISLTTVLGYTLAVSMHIVLHGYHPRQIVWNGVLVELVEQASEMGESELILIHGHGRNGAIEVSHQVL